jgi:polyphenol oxidase
MPEVIEARSFAGMPGVKHGFFTRRGGVSSGVYASLNCGPGSGDDKGKVAENRALAARALGSPPGNLLTLWQTHGAKAISVSEPWRDAADRPKADALVTSAKGLLLAVLTADCAPVLLVDPEARVVAAVHAGWRGALDGIAESAIAAMEGEGATRRRIFAAIGPAIGPDSYEIGPEFEKSFIDRDSANARFFRRTHGKERSCFNLAGFVEARLRHCGVEHIERSDLCTYRGELDFFSHRRMTHRGEPDYGRQISAIVLD